MSEIEERCGICKWWDYDNQVWVKPHKPDDPSWRYFDMAALCKYEYPPKDNVLYGERLYTLHKDCCSGFLLEMEHSREVAHSKEKENKKGNIHFIVDRPDTMMCWICRKKVDKLIQFNDGEYDGDDIEVCEKCLKKATKRMEKDNE